MPTTNLPAVSSDALAAASIDAADLAALRRARDDLSHDSFATRLSGMVGRQVGTLGRLVPAQMAETVARATEVAMKAALRIALASLRGHPVNARRSQLMHKAAATVSGATGGLFGLASLPIELPVSTTIMLRSIGEIARANGEDPSDPDTALACLEVFALGSGDSPDALAEGGYFAARAILAKSVTEAARYLAHRSLVEEGAPVLLRFLSQIGARFGLVVSQKIAAQGVPVLGAAGGAAVNYAFIDHFQAVARGHFTIRRLERRYGSARVRTAFAALAPDADIAAAPIRSDAFS